VASMTLKRVMLQFPTDSQIRYVAGVPARGERVSGLRGEEFVVSEVRREGEGYLVVCVRPSETSESPSAWS
jgi:hypothetical protein